MEDLSVIKIYIISNVLYASLPKAYNYTRTRYNKSYAYYHIIISYTDSPERALTRIVAYDKNERSECW